MAGTGEGMLAGSEAFWFELFLGCVYLAYSSEALAGSYLGMGVPRIALRWEMEGWQLSLLIPGVNSAPAHGLGWCLKHLKGLTVGLCGAVQNGAALWLFVLRP